MALRTYRECSFAEKRAVLRVFWSGRPDGSARINRAAREYAPYALGLIVIISVELLIITGSSDLSGVLLVGGLVDVKTKVLQN